MMLRALLLMRVAADAAALPMARQRAAACCLRFMILLYNMRSFDADAAAATPFFDCAVTRQRHIPPPIAMLLF